MSTFGPLTMARVRRCKAMYAPPDGPEVPFVTGCPWCGLTALLLRPCAGGRTWAARCRADGLRAFVQHPRQLYAPSSLISLAGAAGDAALVRFMHRLDQLGARHLAAHPWERALAGRRPVVQLPRGQLCLSCGEPNTLMVRRDRHDRPYGTCAACGARVFWRHASGLHAALGWTAWFNEHGHEDAWWEAFQTGQRTWARWTTPVVAAAKPEDRIAHRRNEESA